MMGWIILLLILVLAVIGISTARIVKALDDVTFQLKWLRKEVKAGLGVDSSDVDGWAAPGFLHELAEDARKRRAADRKAGYERSATF